MKLYADLTGRRTLQLLSDVGILCWVGLWIWAGRLVHDTFSRLAQPGRSIAGAGSEFRDKVTQAGDAVDNLPVIDDRIAAPLRDLAGAGTNLENAGREFVGAVERTATIIGWTTALVPILIVGISWALWRGRFIRQAATARRFINDGADLDLFALRAMANQPMDKIGRISTDPVAAWRRGDRETIWKLASLELKESGLKPPRPNV